MSALPTARACTCARTSFASQRHSGISGESLLCCLQGPANGMPNVAVRFDYTSTVSGYTPLFRCVPASTGGPSACFTRSAFSFWLPVGRAASPACMVCELCVYGTSARLRLHGEDCSGWRCMRRSRMMQAVMASQRMWDSTTCSHGCHTRKPDICGAVYTCPRWLRPTLRAYLRLTSPSRRSWPALALWWMT